MSGALVAPLTFVLKLGGKGGVCQIQQELHTLQSLRDNSFSVNGLRLIIAQARLNNNGFGSAMFKQV